MQSPFIQLNIKLPNDKAGSLKIFANDNLENSVQLFAQKHCKYLSFVSQLSRTQLKDECLITESCQGMHLWFVNWKSEPNQDCYSR